MGDRTDCTLLLKEPATKELRKLLVEHLGEPEEEDDRYFRFEEVNYAQLPQPVFDFLVDKEIAAAWLNCAGGTYGEGVILFPSQRDWLTNAGEIVLRLSELHLIEQAKIDQAFLDEVWA